MVRKVNVGVHGDWGEGGRAEAGVMRVVVSKRLPGTP